ISRRRGSATALKASEVVAALGMPPIYSHIGICQALFSWCPFFFSGRQRRLYLPDQAMPLRTRIQGLIVLLLCICFPFVALAANSLSGTVYDGSGKTVAGAVVRLHSRSGAHNYETTTSHSGEFHFNSVEVDSYTVAVAFEGKTWSLASPFSIAQGA